MRVTPSRVLFIATLVIAGEMVFGLLVAAAIIEAHVAQLVAALAG